MIIFAYCPQLSFCNFPDVISISLIMDRQTTLLRCKIQTRGHIGYAGQQLRVNWIRNLRIAWLLSTFLISVMYLQRQFLRISIRTKWVSRWALPLSQSNPRSVSLSIFLQGMKLPYIAAVHCYALTDGQGISVFKPSAQTEKMRCQSDDLEAPRYQIDFCGLSAYASIEEVDKSIILEMINHSKNAIFANHSREYGVASVWRMLPLLSRHPASKEWFQGSNQDAAGPSSSPVSPSPAKCSTASSQAGTRQSRKNKKSWVLGVV